MTTKRQLQATFWSTSLFLRTFRLFSAPSVERCVPSWFVRFPFWQREITIQSKLSLPLTKAESRQIPGVYTAMDRQGGKKSNGSQEQYITTMHTSVSSKKRQISTFLYFLCTYSISIYLTLCIIQNNKNIMCKITGNATQCKGSKMPKA